MLVIWCVRLKTIADDNYSAVLKRGLGSTRSWNFGVQQDRERSKVFASRVSFARGLYESDLRDWMYGATSGTIATFVIIAGVVGADLPTMVAPVVGLANLFATGFVTAVRRYTNTKLARHNYELAKPVRAKDVIARNYDLSPCMRSPMQAALNTFAAFIFIGLVPLIAYLLAPTKLSVCVVATVCACFAIGAVKSRYSLTAWWQSGFDTVFLGMAAAALAYAAGHTLRLLIDVSTP
jgi:vacuolar iron transporter family protein